MRSPGGSMAWRRLDSSWPLSRRCLQRCDTDFEGRERRQVWWGAEDRSGRARPEHGNDWELSPLAICICLAEQTPIDFPPSWALRSRPKSISPRFHCSVCCSFLLASNTGLPFWSRVVRFSSRMAVSFACHCCSTSSALSFDSSSIIEPTIWTKCLPIYEPWESTYLTLVATNYASSGP